MDALVAAAVERFGRVDVLVNNAAGNFVVKAEELSPTAGARWSGSSSTAPSSVPGLPDDA